MRGVLRGLFAGSAVACLVTLGLAAAPQSAGPAAVPADAKKVENPIPSSPASIQAGSRIYTKYCRFCHGNTGEGDGPMAPKTVKPSNLTDARWDHGSSDGEIFWVIQNGAPPKYAMKGLRGKVSDQDTWNLVNFVRSLARDTKSH